MKVKELIEILQKCPQDIEVVTEQWTSQDINEIMVVEDLEDESNVWVVMGNDLEELALDYEEDNCRIAAVWSNTPLTWTPAQKENK